METTVQIRKTRTDRRISGHLKTEPTFGVKFLVPIWIIKVNKKVTYQYKVGNKLEMFHCSIEQVELPLGFELENKFCKAVTSLNKIS